MDQFVVSARKYRPSAFDLVVGQEHITVTLKNAIANNHLAHAFLFCGPRGVGKTTCARILAKTINCTNLQPGVEPCNSCESCVAFNNNASFNVHELDAASNNSVDDIRTLVEQVRYPPQHGRYKVYIIDEVHMLSQSAFNAFLKTLEEPPSYAIFILATTEKHKILPTILSRCQIFDFNRIAITDISRHLASIAQREGIDAEPEALEVIARKADGGLRDALSMFDLIATFAGGKKITYQGAIKNLHILDYDYYFRITDAFLAEDLPGALVLFDEILQKGFDGHNFLVGLSEHLRNLLVCKDAATVKLLLTGEAVQQKYLQQAQAAGLSFLLTSLNYLTQAEAGYKTSKNQRLLVEMALIKLCYAGAAVKVAAGAWPGGEKKNSSEPGLAAEPAPVYGPSASGAAPSATASPASNTPSESSSATVGKGLLGKKGLGVKAALAGATAPAQAAQQQEAAPRPSMAQLPQRELALAEVQQAWAAMVQAFRQKNAISKSGLLADRPLALSDGNRITVTFQTDSEVQNFLDLRDELAIELGQRLNAAVRMDTFVDASHQEVKSDRPLSPKEKYVFMAQKNPALEVLREKLGLSLDY